MVILVCMKQVPDPEASQDCFAIDAQERKVQPRGIPPVLSPFDENALELALRIKDVQPESVRITVLSLGKRISNAVLGKALSVGADELMKIEGPFFDPAYLDSHSTAFCLAAAVRKLGTYDLVLAGKQAADTNAGQVGVFLAGLLGIPAVSQARKVEIRDGAALVERVLLDGWETVKVALPAVVIASSEVGAMRYPRLIQRREAKKKPIQTWGAQEIGIEASGLGGRVVLKNLVEPRMRRSKCRMIDAATWAEAGAKLAARMREDGVL